MNSKTIARNTAWYGLEQLIGFVTTLVTSIAIARTLLAETPVVILDEATAFADPDSEAAVQDALAELAAGRTLLVIAHRLYTIAQADQILVLDEGQVVEHGRHDELLARQGRYASLWQAQQGGHP